ncbi:M48 family metallopeptidase [Alicyclobacillus sp. SO9]|uniref:M48 family metallopeptidase n=1 Tax=Alicyclobacillus sp. SO9 TaxID=2665646 RepID=UPI0018E8B23A|nr:SprT family zinc-dependent metalloprotease [Alicyclobacillus sp. SO9]QQE77159.1 M48 family metallopeptidase [Alicyclobacillus sp. SO9]
MHSSKNRNKLTIQSFKGFPVRVQTSTRRRKTITIKVLETEIVVQAPHTASTEEIEKALQKHNNWILSAIEERQSSQHGSEAQDDDGWRRHLLYQGNPLVLNLHRRDSFRNASMKYDGHRLHISVPQSSEHELKLYVTEWFKYEARERLPHRVESWAKRLGASYAKIRIKDVSSRWGSCSTKGNLNFNWRLICAPESVQDYVVVHELCHLWEMNHSKRFWTLVSQALPEYKAAQTWLKIHGKSLYF